MGPICLALLGLGAGLFSQQVHRAISSPMASAVAGTPLEIAASSLPHLGLPLYLSVATIVLGIAAYLRLERIRDRVAGALAAVGWGPDRGFDQVLQGLLRVSFAVTHFIQNGRLHVYLTVTFIVVAGTLFVPMIIFEEMPAVPEFPTLLLHEWTIVMIAVIGLGAVVYARDRLTAIVSLGIQGFAVALLFMLFGAPDLSFTQFMVETLSVVILALVMTRLKLSPSDRRPAHEKAMDLTIATLCGAGFGLLLLKVTQLPFDSTLTQFYEAHSRALAHGRNIVNVIIVDFRGLDTLGEIAVVMVAGLAILALIHVRTPIAQGTEEE
jgi:multicomponent Na+:H+ antiporter subunit A